MKYISTIAIGLVLCVAAVGQTKSFTPVDGATLKARIDSMAVRKVAIHALGQTGDERAVAFFRELLSKD